MNTELFLVFACLSPKQLLTDVNFCTETNDNQKYIFFHKVKLVSLSKIIFQGFQ